LEFEPMIGEDVPVLRPRRGARWPSDLACAPAFFGPLVVCVLFGRALPLAVEVAVLAAFAAAVGWAATAPAGLLAMGSAVVSLNGFRENGLGVLAVHSRVDVPVTVTLLCAWAVAWAVREPSGTPARR
jgi:hypothetical protein